MNLEFQNKIEEAKVSDYKAISLFIKTRDQYLKDNNLERGNKTMNDFLHEIYPAHYDKIFAKFCEELKK